MRKKLIIAGSFFLLLVIPVSALNTSLIRKKNITIDAALDITFRLNAAFTVPRLGMELTSCELKLDGSFYEYLFAVIALDPADYFNRQNPKKDDLCKDIYLGIRFMDQFSLQAGFFKPCYSEEAQLSQKLRSNPDHLLATKKIGPNRDTGIMLSAKNLWELFGFQIGLFNAADLNETQNSPLHFAAAGKCWAEADFTSSMKLKAGYSISYTHVKTLAVKTEFSQGVFAYCLWKINTEQKLFVFAEYLHSLHQKDILNNLPVLYQGVSAISTYRFAFAEALLAFSYLQTDKAGYLPVLSYECTAGLNFYFFEDCFNVKLLYHDTMLRFLEAFQPQITVITQLKF